METKYYLALGVFAFWITVRAILMVRRNILIKRWQEREQARLRGVSAQGSDLADADADYVESDQDPADSPR